jgi:HlyD family secretion protein
VAQGTAVVTVVDVSALGLQADVDETDVLLVKPGVRAKVELDAVPDASYDATVAAVDLSPTTSSRGGVSYHVRLTLGPGRDVTGVPAPAPRPGMSAVAHLQVRTARDAVAVRASAVVRVGSRNAVWVVRGGAARQRLVTVGTQGEDLVAITEGIRPGERVVVTGAERVHAGQKLP